jgi:GNAT superfamily N-acetyltransferase
MRALRNRQLFIAPPLGATINQQFGPSFEYMIILPKDRYCLLLEQVKKVEINNLFARSVIEKHVTGKVFVDNIANPKTAYVIHPYGLSLLFGDYSNIRFNNEFKSYAMNHNSSLEKYEWMQTFPREWDNVLHDLFGNMLVKSSENAINQIHGTIEIHTRVNFNFNRDKYLQNKKLSLSKNNLILETNSSHFEQMPGSVIPLKFWDSAKDFEEKGKGFTLLHNGEIASTAYSAFVHEDKLEIGIETVEKYRGLGFAELTCNKLIDYCLENDLIPIWSCRFENTASYSLAQKLGFELTLMIPFYRLCK